MSSSSEFRSVQRNSGPAVEGRVLGMPQDPHTGKPPQNTDLFRDTRSGERGVVQTRHQRGQGGTGTQEGSIGRVATAAPLRRRPSQRRSAAGTDSEGRQEPTIKSNLIIRERPAEPAVDGADTPDKPPRDGNGYRGAENGNGKPEELRFIEVAGTILPYLELGIPEQDKPSTILAPGISAPAISLFDLAQQMDSHVVILEAPKIGVPKHPTLAWYAEITAEAAIKVTGNETANVAGHSWGGLLVQEMAHQGNLDIDHMGILASIAVRPNTTPFDVFLAIPNYEMLTSSMAIMNPDRSNIDPGVVYGGDIRDNPELIERYKYIIHREIDDESHAKQVRAAMYGAVPLAAKNWAQRVLKRQGPPAIVIIGKDDPIIPHTYARHQARRLHMAVYSIYDGHLLPVTRATEVAKVLRDFNNTPAQLISPHWQSESNVVTNQ